jgi:hypothetical protein
MLPDLDHDRILATVPVNVSMPGYRPPAPETIVPMYQKPAMH